MSTYTHMLIGLDLSDESQQVLTKAKALAESLGTKISVAHVLEPLTFAYGGDVPIDLSEAQAVMEEHAEKRLAQLIKGQAIDVEHQVVALGSPAHELHHLADEFRADLIVVGSHGRHGFALLLGSTAGGVLKGAHCDVLAIHV